MGVLHESQPSCVPPRGCSSFREMAEVCFVRRGRRGTVSPRLTHRFCNYIKKKKSTEENNACVSMYEYLYSVSCEMGITCRVFPQRPGNKYVLLRAGAAVSLLKSFPTLTSLSYWAALKSSFGLIAQFQTIMILTDSMQNLDFQFKRQYFQSSAPVYPSIPPHLCSVHLRSACSY